jgi:hypothetical protein
MTRAYEEIVDFIAGGPSSGAIASWTPSAEAVARVEYLLDASKNGNLSVDEQNELNHSLELEHLMRLVKARARRNCSDD